MIQEILTALTLTTIAVVLTIRLRKSVRKSDGPCGGCASRSCGGCPALDLKEEAERRKAERNKNL